MVNQYASAPDSKMKNRAISIWSKTVVEDAGNSFRLYILAGDENTVSTPMYKLRSACHRVVQGVVTAPLINILIKSQYPKPT